jgi:lysophospholipase L1-like esterase
MARTRKDAVKVAVLLASTILVCIVAAEIVVRVRYGEKFGPRPSFYTADDRLGWKPAPHLDNTFYGPDYQIAIRTDADGYRLGALGEVDYAKELVIVCGDSYAFGWGVPTEQSFASYLDEILAVQSNGRLRVVNLGVGGYGTFQDCDRLVDFFRKHGAANPRLVLLQHSVNDVTDNYRNIGYHLGLWPTETINVERSRFHLANLVRYVRDAREHGEPQTAAVAQEPYTQDLLWAFRRKTATAGIPAHVEFGTRTVEFHGATLRRDVSPDSLAQRKTFTKIQRDLMFEALNCIHDVARMRGLTVVHTFISTTPDWYVGQVAEVVRQSADFSRCRVVVTEALPHPGEFAGPIDNAHSGRHFNADFNQFWATAVMERLDATDLLKN